MGYKLDWLAFTIKKTDDIFKTKNVFQEFKILKKLGYNLSDFDEVAGRYFYNSGLTLGNYVNLYFNDENKKMYGNPLDTINYVFTGQGCTDLYNRAGGDLEKVFQILKDSNVKVTRLDIAYDDYTGVLSFPKITRKLEKGHYRSKKRSYNIIRSADAAGNVFGQTIYIGNPRNETTDGNYYLRMYDKLAQYKAKNQIVPEDVTIWQRYEISYTKKKANEVFYKLANDIDSIDYLYKTTMRSIVEFVDKKADLNKGRWKVSKWWNDFLEFDDKMTFENHEKDAMLGDILAWLRHAVIPNLKLLEKIGLERGFDIYELLRITTYSRDFSKKQERLYNDVKEMSDEQLNIYLNQFLDDGFRKNKLKMIKKGG